MGARTTVRLDDDLMRQLKERAKRDNISLTRLINDVIRRGLKSDGKPRKRKRFVQKTYNMGLPLVDITHTNALLDELDVEEFRRKFATGK
jgi:predicted transcriptional regulator